MAKKLTTEEFIRRAKEIHGDQYDYSKSVYVGARNKIEIICKTHGSFWAKASDHLCGKRCRKCSLRHKPVYGVGINDLYVTPDMQKAYLFWCRMLHRCYDPKYIAEFPTYRNCVVCDEWLTFSNFKKWFDENYVEGYQLDKDILGDRYNKIYSPKTCCFVPQQINKLLLRGEKQRGELPIGVGRSINDKFRAHICIKSKVVELGTYETAQKAFDVYKKAKEKHIKEIATEYFVRGAISERVYNALLEYEVCITD